jgi:hypothetical protein
VGTTSNAPNPDASDSVATTYQTTKGNDMGIKSGGYNATLPEQRPFKYWAQLAAIRRVMRDAPDPDLILDMLFEPMSPTQTATDGNRIYPSRGMGGPSK